jgi:hypothetical protein
MLSGAPRFHGQLHSLKRRVETPRECFGIHVASGNFLEDAAGEQLGSRNPPPTLPFKISCNQAVEWVHLAGWPRAEIAPGAPLNMTS